MINADARYIWSDENGQGRNRWVFFRHSFDLSDDAREGQLCIFSDTRYRLLINGQLLGHGPSRFFVKKPFYDTYDISGCLRMGRNVIAALVNSYGCPSFHSEASVGGLIAWGEITTRDGQTVTLATGSSWKAVESPGHVPETGCLSFALNPGELLDARDMPLNWHLPEFDDTGWPCARILDAQNHWGPLVERPIPLLDEGETKPVARMGSWVARPVEDETVYSFAATGLGRTHRMDRPLFAAMTWLHSPIAQTLTVGGWWGDYWLNGQKVQAGDRSDISHRQDRMLHLDQGWNHLVVLQETRLDTWLFYLGLPRSAGIEVRAERSLDSSNAFLVAGPWYSVQKERAGGLEWPLASPRDLPGNLGSWQPWPSGRAANSAHYDHAWKTMSPIDRETAAPVEGKRYADSVGGDTLVLVYDFGGEVLGRPVLDFTAAAGTAVDLFYSERLKKDETVDQYRRHYVEMAERYLARSGRQQWHLFHPRGFRYLQVLVTGDLSEFALHDLSLTRANYPVRTDAFFECSDERLNRIWAMGRETIAACMEDAYLDCPRRERGVYLGDIAVEFFVDMAAFGDPRLMRHCLDMYCQVQNPSEPVFPNPVHGRPLWRLDYTTIFVQMLWHYYDFTGNAQFLRDAEPTLRIVLENLKALIVEDVGLVDTRDLDPLIEHCAVDKEGVNCSVNCFVQRAFHDAGRIYEVIEHRESAASYRQLAEEFAGRIRHAFWDADCGLFVDRRRADRPDTGPSQPANTLAVLYDIALPEHIPGIVDYVAECLRDNFRSRQDDGEVNTSFYFAFYCLDVLYRHGRAVEAEDFIRKTWGIMLDAGAWTCWETILGRSSRCHAWSAGPTWYLSTAVLGVSFPEPGHLRRVRIAPQPGTLTWAKGAYPHPDGLIEVEWRQAEGEIQLSYSVPKGVEVELGERIVLKPK